MIYKVENIYTGKELFDVEITMHNFTAVLKSNFNLKEYNDLLLKRIAHEFRDVFANDIENILDLFDSLRDQMKKAQIHPGHQIADQQLIIASDEVRSKFINFDLKYSQIRFLEIDGNSKIKSNI